MQDVIRIDGLSKSFGLVKAVDNLSIRVKEGELFAFLGVNGAGKSTTINVISGMLQKDEGKIEINGKDVDTDKGEIKGQIGVVFQNSVLDSALSVYDNLKSRSALYGIVGEAFTNRLNELISLLDFGDFLHRTVSKLSGGQRRRIDIARALIHNPKILILDEPTTGLDPQTRKTLWNVIYSLRKNQNMTVFLTTHYMEEAGEADYIVIIDGGKISAEGSPLKLKNEFTGDYVTLYNAKEEDVKKLGVSYEKIKEAFRFYLPNTKSATDLIVKFPEIFVDYEITKGKMDDVFLAVTGKNLSDGGAK